MSKNIIPEGTSIYMTPEGSVWEWAGDKLQHIEDQVMEAKRLGRAKAIEAMAWLTNNVHTIEQKFEDGDRSLELIAAVTALEIPKEWLDPYFDTEEEEEEEDE
jgi:hypothetical protein